jgi:hypothetical protein
VIIMDKRCVAASAVAAQIRTDVGAIQVEPGP